jgi:hypothetical protein
MTRTQPALRPRQTLEAPTMPHAADRGPDPRPNSQQFCYIPAAKKALCYMNCYMSPWNDEAGLPDFSKPAGQTWCARRDSNPQPLDP